MVCVVRCAISQLCRVRNGGLAVVALLCNSFCRMLLESTLFELIWTNFWRHLLWILRGTMYPSFLFLFLRSRATSQRSPLFPMGCQAYDFVACGNLLCARSVLLLWLACVCQVRWLLEQPHGSIVECMPRMQEVLHWCHVAWHFLSVLFWPLSAEHRNLHHSSSFRFQTR